MRTIKFSPPDISNDEINEVIDTLKSGWITTGPKTKLFENKIATFCYTSMAVCLNSATACLELILRSLGIKQGDEVITSAYSYTASCSPICHVGATPVLIDTARDSYEMDYNQLEKAITSKTKAVIAVDIGGVMCDYDRIFKIVEAKKGLFSPSSQIQEKIGRVIVIADAAHSFGAARNNMPSGSVADFSSFSFHAVKNLTTGEGGALTWRNIDGVDNGELYKGFMLLALHGQSKDALAKSQCGNWEYDIVSTSYKCNMTDIMASIGLAQLRRYSGILAERKKLIEHYNENLKDEAVTILRHYTNNNTSSGHLLLVRLNGKDEFFRNNLIKKMAQREVPTNVHYKPLPMHTAYRKLGFDIKNYPNAFDMYKNEITLPLHTLLTNNDVDYICDVFRDCFYS